MQLSLQLKSEDAKKLAFLMYPTHSQATALEFAEFIEREGSRFEFYRCSSLLL